MAGGSAWEEDMWEGLQIGSLNLSAVKPCDRCKVSPCAPLSHQMP